MLPALHLPQAELALPLAALQQVPSITDLHKKPQCCLGTTGAVLDLPVLAHVLTKGFLCVRMAPGQARPFLLLLMAWHQLGQNTFYGSCSAFTALKLAMDRAVPVLGLVWGGQTCSDSTSNPNLPLGSYSSSKRGSENGVE